MIINPVILEDTQEEEGVGAPLHCHQVSQGKGVQLNCHVKLSYYILVFESKYRLQMHC